MAKVSQVESRNSIVLGAENTVTSPFGLMQHVRKPELSLNLLTALDLLVIAVLVSLVFTRFVVVPGVRVDLPSTDLRMRYTAASVAVLTIQNEGMLLFDGSRCSEKSIEQAFQDYVQRSTDLDVTLLIKAEADMDITELLNLCQMAQSAGFTQVQLAGQKLAEESDGADLTVPSGGFF